MLEPKPCPYCGKPVKNLANHKRFCKLITESNDRIIKPPEPVSKDGVLSPKSVINVANPIIAPVTTIPKRKWYQFWKKRGLTTKQIKEMKSSQPELTDEQKFLKFFGNLPKWTTKKPGWYKTWRLGDRLRHCVLVSRDPKTQDAELFLEYNKELGLLQSDTYFYDMPIKEKGTVFLDADKFGPLINRKDYSADFDIPEDFASSLLNRGIKFGQLAQFKAVLDKIDKMMIICWLLGGLLLLSIIVNILTVHSGNNAIHDLSGQVGNLTSAVNLMRGTP